MQNYFTEIQLEVLLSGFLCIVCGLSIRIVLSLVNQRWASTYHHTMSYILLPVITFTITKVISGNIALSLGMIGALSIVRFRNPVKNPFELVVFFALITIGISLSVDLVWGLFLTLIIDLVIVASYFFEKLSKKFNLHIFSASFDEGNTNFIIEIQASSEVPYLIENRYLTQHVYDRSSGEFFYRLASRSRQDIELIRSNLTDNTDILSVDIRF